MFESNRTKHYFFKYGPLLFSVLLLTSAVNFLIDDPRNIEIAIIPILFSIGLLIIFLRFKDRYKRVTISRMSLFVDEQNKVNEYTWLDVEWIEFNRFVGLYSLKLKSRKAILFTPYGTTWWIFGDMSEMGQIIERKKKELQL